jgi:hypothetical protein
MLIREQYPAAIDAQIGGKVNCRRARRFPGSHTTIRRLTLRRIPTPTPIIITPTGIITTPPPRIIAIRASNPTLIIIPRSRPLGRRATA